MRGSLSSSQYKDVVLGLMVLEYISDAHDESPDGGFAVPPSARWKFLAGNTKANIGELIDEAIDALMPANPALAGHCRGSTATSIGAGSVSWWTCWAERNSAAKVLIAHGT